MTPEELDAFLGLVSYEEWVKQEDDPVLPDHRYGKEYGNPAHTKPSPCVIRDLGLLVAESEGFEPSVSF